MYIIILFNDTATTEIYTLSLLDALPILTQVLPVLPLRDIVVFPQRIVPLFVGREKSVAALEAAMAGSKELFLVAQLDPGGSEEQTSELQSRQYLVCRLLLEKPRQLR